MLQVARELNVHYVVEGSVRKVGSRVRVTVQLIDGRADRHIWAERFDRELQDIFAIQDEVTTAIVATLSGRVEAATHERAGRKPTENMTAYECVLAGKLLHHRSTRDGNEQALRLLDRAISLDPNYAQAHAWKGCTLGQAWVNGFCADREAIWKTMLNELHTALQLDSNQQRCPSHSRRSLPLERAARKIPLPSGARALSQSQRRSYRRAAGRDSSPGLDKLKKASSGSRRRFAGNPYHPERFWNHLGRAFFVRRYDEAISAFGRITAPDHLHYTFLAACSAELGDEIRGTAIRRGVLNASRVLPRRRICAPSITSVPKTLHTIARPSSESRAACVLCTCPSSDLRESFYGSGGGTRRLVACSKA